MQVNIPLISPSIHTIDFKSFLIPRSFNCFEISYYLTIKYFSYPSITHTFTHPTIIKKHPTVPVSLKGINNGTSQQTVYYRITKSYKCQLNNIFREFHSLILIYHSQNSMLKLLKMCFIFYYLNFLYYIWAKFNFRN